MKIVQEPEYAKRKKECRCVVLLCRSATAKKYRFCYRHARQWQKLNNPLRYWFDVQRQNARRRGKVFTLTIEEFKEFCDRENYLELKAQNAGGYTIDRIRDWEGYHKDNIQVLTLSQNSRKRFIDMKLQFGRYPTDAEIAELYKGQDFFNQHIIPQFNGNSETDSEGEEVVPF